MEPCPRAWPLDRWERHRGFAQGRFDRRRARQRREDKLRPGLLLWGACRQPGDLDRHVPGAAGRNRRHEFDLDNMGCDPDRRHRSTDPGELRLFVARNEVRLPIGRDTSTILLIDSATINGVTMVGQAIPLASVPSAPRSLRLVLDSGLSPTDGQTNNPWLHFLGVSNAVGYEYSVSGVGGPYFPIVGNVTTFLPMGATLGL